MKAEVESESLDNNDDETINKDQWDEEKRNLVSFLSCCERDEANSKEDSSSSTRTESVGHTSCSPMFPSAEFESLMTSENFWSEFAVLNEEVIR